MRTIRLALATLVLTTLALALAVAAFAQDPASPVRVQVATSKGAFILELYPDKAPKTVANFLKYVESGFYEGTIFHRVIDGFVIQGGGLTEDVNGKKTLDPVLNEAENGLKNEAYTVAMARGPHPDSATSQFYVNLKWNRDLDHVSNTLEGYGYCVFGKVYTGQRVVDEIAGVKVRAVSKYLTHLPVEPVVIERITLLP